MRLGFAHGFGVLVLLVASAVGTSESASYAGPAQPVQAAYFGMHIHRAASGTPWPDVPFVGWRLWDAQVTWPQLEPDRGSWNFALLDRYTNLAAEHHAQILLTLGLTPEWASSRPQERSAYGPGNAAEPRQLADWETYVRAIATRYKGVIHEYEIWNEPNLKGTFTGNVSEMIELSRTAYRVLKSVDPTVVVVSPSATGAEGLPWLKEFLKGGGCQYADVIGYHFYVTPNPPEAMVRLIQRVKGSLHQNGCSKPLWNTESGWASPKHFKSDEESAGYLMRTYVLNWLLGVQRCYWYAWDNHNWSTLDLTSRSSAQMTSAGAAYGVVRGWLTGSVLRSCDRPRSGIWLCQLERADSMDRLLWSDKGTQTFAVPSSWRVRTVTTWTGQSAPAADIVIVGNAPILLSGDRQASSSLLQPANPTQPARH